MDQILKGIIESSHPDSVKRAFVNRTFLQVEEGRVPPSQIQDVLRTSLDMAASSDKLFVQEITCQVFVTWAKLNAECLVAVMCASTLLYLLESKEHPNKMIILRLIKESVLLMQDKIEVDEIFPVIQERCIILIVENETLMMAHALSDLMLTAKDCIPEGMKAIKLAVMLVRIVANTKFPADKLQSTSVMCSLVTVTNLFRELWPMVEKQNPRPVLNEIFLAVSSTTSQPCSALGGVVQFIPLSLAPNIVLQMMSDTSISDSSLVVALQRIINWLVWPNASAAIAGWVIELLRGLAMSSKFSVLIHVTQNTIEQVFDFMEIEEARPGALAVFRHMLLSYQHTPDVFHKVVGKIPAFVGKWLKQVQPNKPDPLLVAFVDLIHTMMYLHTGFPELYDPILTALKNIPRPSVDAMNRHLSENKWTSTGRINSTFHLKGITRSETGKTGLHNLGNTCYMNSVLQALYMTDRFRNSVLTSEPQRGQAVLHELQLLFALLTHTQRAAFTPVDFSHVSRPPWFEKGNQQDCSEYLRYLLDILHEQELGLSNPRVAGSPTPASTASSNNSGVTSTTRPRAAKRKSNQPDPVVVNNSKQEVHVTNNALPVLNTPSTSRPTLIQESFAGQLVTSYQCLACRQVSERAETFIDLPLSFPQCVLQTEKEETKPRYLTRESIHSSSRVSEKTQVSDRNGHSEGTPNLLLEDLLDYYLLPEKLEGENMYFCGNCGSLQEAERSIHLMHTPRHLVLTLHRFSYNAKTHSRSKILKDVRYPLLLQLPIGKQCSSKSDLVLRQSPRKHTLRSASAEERHFERFYLYAVVVHSGTSSESGHYYAYARPVSDICCDDGSDGDYANDNGKWFLFNDSHVTFSSYTSFCTVTERFPKDTAYLLLYQKAPSEPVEASSCDLDPKLIVLKRDIREAIEKDHISFLQEQEQEAKLALQRQGAFKSGFPWKDFDDDTPPGSCGGGGGGFSSLNSGNIARFVC